jgi:response regulator RpfG family c-di-GMP phosphodiesterase
MSLSITCLLIDDDIDDHEIFKIALAQVNQSINCISINESKEAIEKLSTDTSFTPDIIFVDINMPVLNGIECLAEIKKIDHLKNVPVIFYSTFADPEKLGEMKELGAAEYFEKPSDIDLLTAKLSSVFKEYKIIN